MTYDWYNIFNLADFLEEQLVSRSLLLTLEGQGLVTVLITQGNEIGITIEDTFLIVNFEDQNPYAKSPYAVYKDTDDNVWLGFEVVA